MNNFIAEIAEKLGVKMGEEFRIKNNRDPVNYFFTEKGLKARYPFLDDDSLLAANTLMGLITGEVEIVKMPWLPKHGEEYRYIHTDDGQGCIFTRTWHDTHPDRVNYLLGNCFKTSEEANKVMDRFAKFLKEKEPDTSWRDSHEDND